MKNYRLKYSKLDSQGMYQVIFTTIIQAKSARGAKMKAKNLAPFNWSFRDIVSLESELNLKLDKIEFNY
jgi:hypothetical protein